VPTATAQLAPPILVSIRTIGKGSYVVTTIRQRRIAQGDDSFITTRSTLPPLTLRKRLPARLSIDRELLASADVDKAQKAMRAWIASVGSATGSR